MARTKGPLFSLEASGSLAKTIVYSQWKGRNYVREHTIPYNPQSAEQVNVRAAMTLSVAYWQTQAQGVKDTWNEFGKQFTLSGFNSFVGRAMEAYVAQLGTSTTPASVTIAGTPPTETWTWT